MRDRVKWCLVGAVGAMAVGWLPWFTWALVEKGSEWAWARVLLRGAAFLYLPNELIGDTVIRMGWVGVGPFLAIHLLTLGFSSLFRMVSSRSGRQIRLRHSRA